MSADEGPGALPPLVTAALDYAARGWRVFPCHPAGKTPLVAHGCKNATTDRAAITAWWTQWPTANVAIATGDGLVVVDVDGRQGKAEATKLGLYAEPTLCAVTQKGEHLYFSTAPDVVVKNAVRLKPELDIRGTGGYVIAPPSIHASGHQYTWVEADVLPLRPDVLALAANGNGNGKAAAPGKRVTEGQRNDVLFKFGCGLRAKGMDTGEIAAALAALNVRRCEPPLTESELATIAASVAKYEAPAVRRTVALVDPEPAADPVDGELLLDQVAAWFERYLWLPAHAAVTMALWVAATWCRDELDYAPLLAVLSATKRCGKSHLLELLSRVVRRGHRTSAAGVTVPVLFRLNESQHPTLCMDECEKLAGRDADKDLVGLLNQGYEPGATVYRLQETKGGYELLPFDAFGFRALAAIGSLWDTLTDRAILLRLARKPKEVPVARLNRRKVAAEGAVFARQFARWAKDHAAAVGEAQLETPQPAFLNDRECDNWGPLLAVARVMGGVVPSVALLAAEKLSGFALDEGDRGERLLTDVRRVFQGKGYPEVLKSGDLVTALNDLDDAPWGDDRKGKGLSTHGLAAVLRRFTIHPRLARDGGPVRGYWWADIQPVADQWLPAA